MYTAQLLSVEGSESGSTTEHCDSAQKVLSRTPQLYTVCTEKGYGSLAEPIGFLTLVDW